MSGRYERTQHIEDIVEYGLFGYPPILKLYYRKCNKYQASSKHVYVNAIKRFCDYLKRERKFDMITVDGDDVWYKKVNDDIIVDYLNHIKVKTTATGKRKVLSDSTIKTTWKYLNNFFEFLLSKGYISKNPVADTIDEFPRCKTKKEVVYMTEEEVEAVQKKILEVSPYPTRDLCIFLLGCRTGLRQSAIIDIDISDIDFDEQKIRVIEKGNVDREILLDDDTVDMIKEYLAERGDIPGLDALFVKVIKGGFWARITAYDMRMLLEDSTIDLKKRITPHKMRATCATNLYLQTGDIYMVAEKIGHANIENTKRYTAGAKKAKEAADIMGKTFKRYHE